MSGSAFTRLFQAPAPVISMLDGSQVEGGGSAFDGTVWNNAADFITLNNPPVAGLTHHTIYHPLTQHLVGLCVYLPPEYITYPRAAFPVIYWFFGSGGDENDTLTSNEAVIPHYNGLYPAIVVFANYGRNNKYRDATPDAPMYNICMADNFLINSLIPAIDGTYRTTSNKYGRAFIGSSMGGQGALRYAFKYPQLVSSVYAMMSAIVSSADANSTSAVTNMYNGNNSAFDNDRAQAWATANAANIITQALKIHFTVGQNDTGNSPTTIYQLNLDLDTQLTNLSITHDAAEVLPGVGHDQPAVFSAIGTTDLTFMANNFSQHTPILWSPTVTGVTVSGANCNVSTNTANGTLYVVVTTSAVAPTFGQILAGTDNSGVAAAFAGNQSISSCFSKTIAASGLVSSTQYSAHFTHRNVGGTSAGVVSSARFTTS